MTSLEYVQQKGFEHKQSAGQIILKRCPFCGDTENHFYIDPGEGGPFLCHKCQAKGNLFTLRKHLGDFHTQPGNGNRHQKAQAGISRAFPEQGRGEHRPAPEAATRALKRLLQDTEVLKYVTETRGLSIEAVNHFNLGLEVDKDGTRWLTIPHFIKDECMNIKSRTIPPAEKTFRRIKDCPSVLFNADALEGAEEIFITEGEIDAISLWGEGIKNVIGATTGAGSFDPEWIDQLKPIKKIYLCYDPDEPGQKGAREVARRLGYGRCFNVVLPEGQDVNEFFISGMDIFDFQSVVNQSERFDVAGIMSVDKGISQFGEELRQPDKQTGILFPWPSVNRLVPTGFQPGELVVLSAPPKTGKSSFALQIAGSCALRNIPSLFYCLEMRPMKIIQKIIQCSVKADSVGQEELQKARRAFSGKPLYLGYHYQAPDRERIFETLKEAIQRYGLKLLVFDHLHFLCRSISNQVQEIGLAVQAFKFLAEEMEIPIILIAQPRKIQADSIMTAMDLKDSSSIFSDCDHLIILHRQRLALSAKDIAKGKQPLNDQASDPVTLVRIEASRYNPGGECLLYFHGNWSHFSELTEVQ